MRKVKQFYRNIVRCVRWFPIIWQDRDYDHAYILILLRSKLRFVREDVEKHSPHTCKGRTTNEIKRVELALDRIIENRYINWKDENCEDLYRISNLIEREEYLIKQDLEYITKQLNKNLRKWWW